MLRYNPLLFIPLFLSVAELENPRMNACPHPACASFISRMPLRSVGTRPRKLTKAVQNGSRQQSFKSRFGWWFFFD